MPLMAQRSAEKTCAQSLESAARSGNPQRRPQRLQRAVQARLVVRQPVHGLVVAVVRLQWMQARVGHDADGVRARGQRNHPHPVARAAQVVGERQRRRVQRGARRRRPSRRWTRAATRTRRRWRRGRWPFQSASALDQTGAAGRVDDPARLDLLQRAVAFVLHPVRGAGAGQLDLAHRGAVDELGAQFLRAQGKEVLEDTAVDLVAGRGNTALTPSSVVAVTSSRPSLKKKRKPNLRSCACLGARAVPTPCRNSARRSPPWTRRP